MYIVLSFWANPAQLEEVIGMAKCRTRKERVGKKPGPKNVKVKEHNRSKPSKPKC